MKIRQARKIVRRTLRCFDHYPRFGKPGYSVEMVRRAALRFRQYRRARVQWSKYEWHVLEVAIAFFEPTTNEGA